MLLAFNRIIFLSLLSSIKLTLFFYLGRIDLNILMLIFA